MTTATQPKKGTDERTRLLAFLQTLDDKREVLDASIEGNTVTMGREEYEVLTDEEATERAKEYIKESVWAFKKEFLNAHSEAINEIDDDAFAKLQEGCERINNAVWAMIDDKDHFMEDAIASDGRAHFLNTYDDQEQEARVNGVYYYVYRIN